MDGWISERVDGYDRARMARLIEPMHISPLWAIVIDLFENAK